MKNTFLIILSLVAFLFVGCMKENALQNEVGSQKSIVTFIAKVEETKTTESTASFSWAPGETISVGSNATGYQKYYDFTSEAGDGSFSGTIDDGARSSVIIAVSPAQPSSLVKPVYSSSTYYVNLPSEYSYSPGVTNALLVGNNQANPNMFIFKHAASLIKVKYTNIPSWARAVKLTTNNNITGTVNAGATNNSRTNPAVPVGLSGLEGNSITINFTSAQISGGIDSFYFPVPYGSYSTISVCLLDENGEAITATARTMQKESAYGTPTILINKGDVFTFPTIVLDANLSEEIEFVSKTLGDYGSGFPRLSAKSGCMTISSGELLHLEFTNYTNKVHAYENWILQLTNNYDSGDTNYEEIGVIRADGCYEVGDPVTFPLADYSDFGTIGYWRDKLAWDQSRWEEFKSDMEGAKVVVEVNNPGNGKIFVSAIQTATQNNIGQQYVETFTIPVSVDVVRAFLSVYYNKVVISKAWKESAYTSFSVSDRNNFSKTYYKVSGTPVLFDKNSVKVVATKRDGSKKTIDRRLVKYSDIATSVEGTTSVTADFGGLTQQTVSGLDVKIGSVAAGGWDCLGLFDWGGGTAKSSLDKGKKATIKFMLYSGMRFNWHGPILNIYSSDGETKYQDLLMDHRTGKSSGIDSNWDWSVFASAQNHSLVTLTITNANSSLDVRYDITYANGDTHFQSYTGVKKYDTVDAGAAIANTAIQYNISTEHAYIVIYDTSLETVE